MKRQSLAAATAVALLIAGTAPAFADSAGPAVTQNGTNQIANSSGPATSTIVDGAGAGASGNIGFNATAGNGNEQTNAVILEANPNAATGGGLNASTTTSQTITEPNPGTVASGSDTSTLGSSTASASVPAGNQAPAGNFSANSAAGDFNQQSNLVVLSQKPAQANASDNTTQTITANGNTNAFHSSLSGTYDSTLTGTMGQNVTGNAAFNSTAGDKNLQSNDLLLFGTGASGNTASATQTAKQTITGERVDLNGSATATVNGNALQGASGNVGANVAAGAVNLQSNAAMLIAAPTVAAPMSQSFTTGQNTATSVLPSTANATLSATVGGNAATSSTGNVALNNAAGTTATQANQLMIGAPSGFAVSQSVSLDVAGVVATPFTTGPGVTSEVNGNAGMGGAGNYGVNNTAGASNAQVNQTLLARGTASTVDQTLNSTVQSEVTLLAGGPTSSDVSGNVAQNASGNVGVNGSAGARNEQTNALLVVNGDATKVSQAFDDSAGGASYISQFVWLIGQQFSAAIGGNTAENATGNVGVNSASGASNIQTNAALFVNGGAASVTQTFAPNMSDPSNDLNVRPSGNPGFKSTIDGSAAYQAGGNVGFNSAAGLENIQANGIVIVSGAAAAPSIRQSSPAGRSISNILGSNDNALSSIGGNAGSLASGRIGFNSAAGSYNTQSNAVALYTGAVSSPSSTQDYAQNAQVLEYLSGSQQAYARGSAGAGATGIVGLNSVVGTQNEQANATSVFAPNASGTPASSINAQQSVQGCQGGCGGFLGAPTVVSEIGQNVVSGAQGQVSVNVAAGIENQQLGLVTVIGNGATGAGSPVSTVGQTITHQTGYPLFLSQGGSVQATIQDNAFAGAGGALSANSTAGAANQQTNALTLTTGNLADIAPSTTQAGSQVQIQALNANTSTIGGNAFQGASGVMGASASSGIANQQGNNVVVQH